MFRPTFIVAALCLLEIVIEATPKTKLIEKTADIMFVLDSSTSIWIRNYREQLKYVAGLVDSFGVGKGKSKVRVGVITYSDQAYLEFSLDRYTDSAELKKTILNIPHRRGSTNTADALRLLKEQVEPNMKNSKGPTIAIVITDGNSMDPDATNAEAEKLHQLGINVYAIGVGNSTMYDINELKSIASDPDKGVYTVSSYSALKEITQTFYVNECEETTTSKSTTTTTTTTAAPTITTTTAASTSTTTITEAPTTTATTTAAPTTTTGTPAPPTTTTTEVPSTITTTVATTTKMHKTEATTSVKEPQNAQPEYRQKDQSSIILFGYDLVAVGAYGSGMIHQFISSLIPYTGYGHYGVVSHGYCPTNFNVPMTSLMGKDPSSIKNSVFADGKLPDLVDVVRKMRNVLYISSYENPKSGYLEKQTAVLFVDPSVTTITPELTNEIEMFTKDGVKLYLINVGTCPWPQPDQIYSMSSQPYHKCMFSVPSYRQLLLKVQHNPLHFRPIYNQYAPNISKPKTLPIS